MFPVVPVSRPAPLAQAIRALCAGGLVLGIGTSPARAGALPVPADVLVAPGAGTVLAPTISGNTMTIRQLTEKATLDWKSFNIGKENTVRFDQPSSTSVALNRIHQSSASEIFGTLTANGQVYLINQNGFLFGRDSQINVNSLVASTLNISDEAFKLGISQVFDQTKQSALSATNEQGQPTKQLYLKDANGQPVVDQNGQKVKVQIYVDEGANIKTNGRDGRIILAAPSVTNAGNIEAADGQVILAASQDKVYLQQADADSDIRGLLVEVGTGGDVNNVGKILAERGNASLIGFAVNQTGRVSASTSVKLNGSVRLMAREGIQDPLATGGKLLGASTRRSRDIDDGLGQSAKVTLGKGSVTSVELSSNKTETAVDAQAQARSRVEISGHKIHLTEGSTVRAKSGKVQVKAQDDLVDPNVRGNSRIYVDKGATIDVSGVKNVELPMERNVVKVELRSNELRDAPLQRKGVLYGKTISVDVREVGKDGRLPIADVSGALDRIARNIDERSTSGGNIGLESSGDVIARTGSVLDFSGGSVAFQSGYINTSKLLSNGQIYDIATADPNRRYESLVDKFVKDSPKWGASKSWALSGVPLNRFEKGYVEGKDGGSLDIAAFEAELDGILQGKTDSGINQRAAADQPLGSSLNIDLNRGNLLGNQDVVLGQYAPANTGADDPFPLNSAELANAGESAPLNIAPDLFTRSGIRNVSIKTNGALRIEAGARVALPKNGSLHLEAAGFDVQGSVVAPSGDVSLKPASYFVDGKREALASAITIGSDARILAGGEWVNDILNPGGSAPVALEGGHVSLLTEQGDLTLESGSQIDVSGGGWLRRDSTLLAGRGGFIELTAATKLVGEAPSSLNLWGQLSGWGLEQGGRLGLTSNEVFIGSYNATTPDLNLPARSPLVLSADFFQQGGFADYSIGSNYQGITVTEGTQVRPLQRNRILTSDAAGLKSRDSLLGISQPVTLRDTVRGPANIKLSMSQTLGQDRTAAVKVEQGAAIETDPQGSITLNSDTSVIVDGTLKAPAGKIAINVTTPAAVDTGFFDSQGIWLGSNARLLAPGVFKAQPDGSGLKTGDVLAGGSVELTANRGTIVTDSASLIDVSGTSAILQYRKPVVGSPNIEVVNIGTPSAGGRVGLTAGEGIIADGALNARAGGKGVLGGSLSVELNGLLRSKPADSIPGGEFPDDRNPAAPRSIIVTAGTDPSAPDGLMPGNGLSTASYSGKALLGADNLNNSGFDTIALKTDAYVNTDYVGRIEFRGDVSLNAGREIILDSPTLSWSRLNADDTGVVSLSANRLAMGSTQSRIDQRQSSGNFSSTLAPEAKSGEGTFSAKAKGLDLIGGLSFSGIGKVDLSSEGDVRAIGIRTTSDTKNFLGELKIAGDLNIAGTQFYPTTLTDYIITASGANDSISLVGNGYSPGTVLSAGGSLTLNAGNIIQGGVLRAPFGELRLNASNSLELADASLTSVSSDGATIPFGRGSGNLYWLFPLDASGSNNRVIDTPPEKRITLNGQGVSLSKGATVDLSGGGDLYGYEFITGPGGSNDLLDTTSPGYAQKFAVMPGVYSVSTPYDPTEFPASGLKMGDSVYLGAAAGLKEGWYSLLPAHYALLPGAYLVTPELGTRDLAAGQSFSRLDGSTVVAGRYGVAGTSAADSRWQGFAVEPGEIARTRSQYQDYSADQFFADKALKEGTVAPRLPEDAGSLAISAQVSLALGANLVAAAGAKGAGGQVDINATRLAIVGQEQDLQQLENGTVGLLAQDLSQLNVESLLLGGLRSQEKNGRRVHVVSDSVTVAGNAHLSGSEILLAAREQVKLESGAVVESTGKSDAPTDSLLVSNRVNAGGNENSDGALVRVSSLGQVDVTRDKAVSGNTGVLVVDEGATLKAEGSMLLDSTRDTRFAGDIAMQGGSLALKSSKISMGDAPSGTPGLVLKDTGFKVDELKLTSASELNFYGSTDISTQQLLIDAAAINGFNNGGSVTTINADYFTLRNTGGKAALSGNGTGELVINANTIKLGEGQYSLKGFQQVGLTATEALLGDTGKVAAGSLGRLSVAGDLNVKAGHISGTSGATTEIEAIGHKVSLEALALPEKPENTTGLGVAWTVRADAIDSTARFDLPSGSLDLKALKGDVRLGAGSLVDVSGQSQAYGNLTRYTPAGRIQLEAQKGNVSLDANASLNLAGAAIPEGDNDQASNAGALTVKTPEGQFEWNGAITASAAAGSQKGQFLFDGQSFGEGGLSRLSGKLGAAGFTETLSLRQRSGDISLLAGDSIKAKHFELLADTGRVNLAGVIDASGLGGGRVSIKGGGGVTLGGGAVIDAHATGDGENGGKVTLDTLPTGLSAQRSGVLDLSGSSVINVGAGEGGEGGSVHLRTGRDDDTGGIAVTDVNSSIIGSGRAVLEAARVYTDVATVDEAAIGQYQADTAAFMKVAQGPTDRSGANLILAPGIDIRNSGNMTLSSAWDFMAKDEKTGDPLWRWNGTPGYLSLTAGGDLNIRASLTDAFATSILPDPLYGTLKATRFQDTLQPGYSWSYSLAAGKDLRLANAYEGLDPLKPSTTTSRQVMVRTGTGDIDLSAGSNIVFEANIGNPKLAAAVYTMGRPADFTFDDLLQGKIPGLTPIKPNEDLAAYLQRQDASSLADVLRWGTFSAYNTGYGFLAEYPTHGGDINLSAGGNITGVQTGQMMSDWLVRSGTWNNNPADPNQRPTAWGINVSGSSADQVTTGTDENGQPIVINEKGRRFFNQNVGALGGGNVSVSAGGNVTDLSVVIPTSGKPMGIVTAPRNQGQPDLRVPDGASDTQWIANGTEVNGGGELSIMAGGDIRGGEYYTGQGSGRLNAGGSIAASGSNLGAVIGLGDSRFELTARRDVVLGSALNPTLLPQQTLPDSATRKNSFFFTYTNDSSLSLAASGGNVVLQNDIETLKRVKGYTSQDGTGFEMAIYPGTLRAAAPAGDVRIDDSLSLYPSSQGQFELLAGANIGTNRTADGVIKVNVSDTDPTLLPQIDRPETGLLGDLPRRDIKTRERFDAESPLASAIHAASPVHLGSQSKATVIANQGDIAFSGGVQMKLFMPKVTEVQAGRDIRNVSVYAQNLAGSDITRIQAGRDIVFGSRLDANGGVVPLDQRIQLDGPGRLQVLAGRNINLGSSSGIQTIGNLFNRALSRDGGASIDVLAGLSDKVDFTGFINQYLKPGGEYLGDIKVTDALGNDLTANLTPDQKQVFILALPDEKKLSIVQDVLFSEIKASAAKAAAAPASERTALYQRGFDAIKSLFPGDKYEGDLALVFSQIKTLSGGDINIDTPGGKVDVGLAGKVGGIRKKPDELGIVAQTEGNVNAYVLNNFNVNQSRVFTMGGGDIAIWSSKGDIDAGKGAKSAISAPPPKTGVDENGNIVTIFPPIVSGSGIQAISPADSAARQGNVTLAAPSGVVNAGEAGISGGQVVIAASAVVGASNIQASGGTVGVPTAVSPPVVSAGVSGAAAGAAKAATQSGGLDDAARGQDSMASQTQAQAAGNEAQANLANNNNLLNAEIIGYGTCSVQDVLSAKEGCGGG